MVKRIKTKWMLIYNMYEASRSCKRIDLRESESILCNHSIIYHYMSHLPSAKDSKCFSNMRNTVKWPISEGEVMCEEGPGRGKETAILLLFACAPALTHMMSER